MEKNKIIECVPNFSEGRKPEVISAIIENFKNLPDCTLLDYRSDKDHNRLVVSLLGKPEPVCEALLKAAKTAVKLIDMGMHEGAHPRIGAIDVIPFVPVFNIDMNECVKIAHNFGRLFNKETKIPVFFYEKAALKPERKRLEVIRKGQYEVLKKEIVNPEKHPDIGEPKMHPTAGATIIGARNFLIAFNVNLGTSDVTVAQKIAEAVRASSGGYMFVKGIGLALEQKNITQVSMNVVDYEKNSLYRVLETIRMEAKRWGVPILEAEVYGMVPAKALLDSAAYYMQLTNFNPNQVVELAMLNSI